MDHRLSPRAGVLALLVLAVMFASNHVAARLAFEHGTSVTTAVAMRSAFTVLFVLALLRLQRVPLAMPRATLARAAAVGVLIALQSYSLYSAVARLPVALALLGFNTFPILLALLAWALLGERPRPVALFAMPLALGGLALALDVFGQPVDAVGIAWALTAAVSFAFVLLATGTWLKELDGRLRTLVAMAVTAMLVIAAGVAADAFALPQAAAGWIGLALLCVLYGSAITSLFIVLPRLGAAHYALVLNFEPIAALFLAWAILGQVVSPLQTLGAFVVVAAILLLAFKR